MPKAKPIERKRIVARPHPSGRPRHDDQQRGLSVLRIPFDGPLTPALRSRERVPLFGFHADIIAPDYED